VRYVDSFTGPSTGGGRGQSLYIVMELVEGSSLMELINSHIEKNQRIPEKRVRQLLVPLCHALYYIHKKKKITHRDMKPQNILINTEIDVLTGETVNTPTFP
jgi:serine/threonine protein kinase